MKGIVRNGLITKVRTEGKIKRNGIKGKFVYPYMDTNEVIGLSNKEIYKFRGQAKIVYKKMRRKLNGKGD